MKICYKNIGIIVIHGFGGNITEVEPLSKKLSLLGYIVETPQLRGHTGIKKDLKTVTYRDWIEDIENTYITLKAKCQEIIIVGYSMGGLLSFQIANKFKVKGIITLNTQILIGNFWQYIKYLMHFNMFHFKKLYKSLKTLPFKAFVNFNHLIKETKEILPKIKNDIFVNEVINDEVIKSNAHYLQDNALSKNKKIMFYNKSDIADDVIIDLVKYIENC